MLLSKAFYAVPQSRSPYMSTFNFKFNIRIMFYSREERIKKVEFDCEAIAIQKSLFWHCDVRQGG